MQQVIALNLIGETAAGKTVRSVLVSHISFTASKSEFTENTTVQWSVCIICHLRNSFASLNCFLEFYKKALPGAHNTL